jgi:hypothetical protein
MYHTARFYPGTPVAVLNQDSPVVACTCFLPVPGYYKKYEIPTRDKIVQQSTSKGVYLDVGD